MRQRYQDIPRIARDADMSSDSHLTEHVPHAGAHVTRDHYFDVMVSKEACHTRVVRTLGSRVVEAVPADIELLPGLDPVGGHLRDRDSIGSPPTRVHEPF
jgi:hypothetical protein